MTTPFIFITTHRVEPQHRAELIALTAEYTEFMRDNEADLIAHYSYLDDTGTELSLVQIHRDAASAERHMRLAGPQVARGVAITEAIRVQAYGEPGPIVQQALRRNAEAGAQLVTAPHAGQGFTRHFDGDNPTTGAA